MPNPRKRRPRGVVDTSVLVSGIAAFRRSESGEMASSAAMLWDWIRNDTFLWLVSEDILDEYKAILRRRKVRPGRIGEAIHLIRECAEEVAIAPGNEISPDPGDEPFCICAEEGDADFIVTLNPDDFPQGRLRAHVIAPGDPIPTTARKRPRKLQT